MARPVEIGGHFPDIAHHVVQTIGVGLEAADRRDTLETIAHLVVDREDALPSIGGIRFGLVGVLGRARAGGEFPLRLGRQPPLLPGGICLHVVEGQMDHGLVGPGVGPLRSIWFLPVGPGDIGPPVAVIARRPVGRGENARTRFQQVRWYLVARYAEDSRVDRHLRNGDEFGRLDEFTELAVGYFVRVDPEAGHACFAQRAFLVGVHRIASHYETAAFNAHGAVGNRLTGSFRGEVLCGVGKACFRIGRFGSACGEAGQHDEHREQGFYHSSSSLVPCRWRTPPAEHYIVRARSIPSAMLEMYFSESSVIGCRSSLPRIPIFQCPFSSRTIQSIVSILASFRRTVSRGIPVT